MTQAALDQVEPGQQTVWQDVIRDVDGPNAAWQFMNADGGSQAAPPPVTASGQNPISAVNDLLTGDPMARINAELQALIGGQQSPMTQSAVLRLLTGSR